MTEASVPCLWVLHISSFPDQTGIFTAPLAILPRRGTWPLFLTGVTPVPTKGSLPGDFLTFLGPSQEHKSSNTNKKLSEPFSQGSGPLIQGFYSAKRCRLTNLIPWNICRRSSFFTVLYLLNMTNLKFDYLRYELKYMHYCAKLKANRQTAFSAIVRLYYCTLWSEVF